jgi:hypothetical protein
VKVTSSHSRADLHFPVGWILQRVAAALDRGLFALLFAAASNFTAYAAFRQRILCPVVLWREGTLACFPG